MVKRGSTKVLSKHNADLCPITVIIAVESHQLVNAHFYKHHQTHASLTRYITQNWAGSLVI